MKLVLFYIILINGFLKVLSHQNSSCISELTSGPNLPEPLNQYIPSDFNLISLNNFIHPSSGDVQGWNNIWVHTFIFNGLISGRVAVRNNATFGSNSSLGFSVGYGLDTGGPNPSDNSKNFSLVVGDNLDWEIGALYPDGSGIPYPGSEEGIYIGGVMNGPSYLTTRQTGGPCASPVKKK